MLFFVWGFLFLVFFKFSFLFTSIKGKINHFPLSLGLLLISRSSVQLWGICGTNPQGMPVLLIFFKFFHLLILSNLAFLSSVKSF